MHCDGLQCNPNLDTPNCCDRTMQCGSHACSFPDVYVHKNEVTKFCIQDQTCDTDCCEEREKCSEHTCGNGMTLTANSSRRCTGAQCTAGDADDRTCCFHANSCQFFGDCADGTALIKGADHKHCHGQHCGEAADQDLNRAECCGPRASCDNYQCPYGYKDKGTKSSELCEVTECEASSQASKDTLNCCDQNPVVSSADAAQGNAPATTDTVSNNNLDIENNARHMISSDFSVVLLIIASIFMQMRMAVTSS